MSTSKSSYNELIKLQTDAQNAYENMIVSKKIFIRQLGYKINEAISFSKENSDLTPLVLIKEYFERVWPGLWAFYALNLEMEGWQFKNGIVIPPTD